MGSMNFNNIGKKMPSSMQNCTHILSCWGSLQIFGNSCYSRAQGNKREGRGKETVLHSRHVERNTHSSCYVTRSHCFHRLSDFFLILKEVIFIKGDITPDIPNSPTPDSIFCITISSCGTLPYFHHQQTWEYCKASEANGRDKFVCSSLCLEGPRGRALCSPLSYHRATKGISDTPKQLFISPKHSHYDQATEQLVIGKEAVSTPLPNWRSRNHAVQNKTAITSFLINWSLEKLSFVSSW